MGRNRTIDAFRGISILGMIFFTVTLKISSTLPDPLRHNVRDSLHIGDFVLPLFLFASGLSLAYYVEKGKKENRMQFLRKVIGRFGKLAFVGLSLSFFSAYGFLEMDEVMLIAISFLACIALERLDWKILICLVLLIDLTYLILMRTDRRDIFEGHYLGGYPAILYYLQIMLIGSMIGKGIVKKGLFTRDNIIIISFVLLFFIFFLMFIPVDKLTVSPSFMLLSILLSFLVFSMLHILKLHERILGQLEYMGQRPLRFWLLMYILVIIPLRFWTELSQRTRPLDLDWPLALLFCGAVMLLFWWVSRIFDELIH